MGYYLSKKYLDEVTILILIDGFLQSEFTLFDGDLKDLSQSLF